MISGMCRDHNNIITRNTNGSVLETSAPSNQKQSLAEALGGYVSKRYRRQTPIAIILQSTRRSHLTKHSRQLHQRRRETFPCITGFWFPQASPRISMHTWKCVRSNLWYRLCMLCEISSKRSAYPHSSTFLICICTRQVHYFGSSPLHRSRIICACVCSSFLFAFF